MTTRHRQTYMLTVLSDEEAKDKDAFRCHLTRVATGEQTLFSDWNALVRYLDRGLAAGDDSRRLPPGSTVSEV